MKLTVPLHDYRTLEVCIFSNFNSSRILYAISMKILLFVLTSMFASTAVYTVKNRCKHISTINSKYC
jgi:hypothetical protein